MDGFVFYRSFGDALRDVPADQYKAIMTALIDYALDGIEPDLSGLGYIVFTLIKPQIDANNKRREDGKKGGRPKKAEDNTEKTSGFENENHRLETEKPKEKEKEKVKEKDKVKDKEKDKEKDKDKDVYCTEPETDISAPAVVIALPLHDGSEFDVTQEYVDKWINLYPAVDIMQELRKMRGWLDANKTRRKTRRGVLAFVANWLSKEQDKGAQRGAQRPQTRPQTRFHNMEERPYTDDDEAVGVAWLKAREA